MMNAGNNKLTVNTQNISNGVYLITVRSESLNETLKVIINK
jgi:hypothetical protein